jgi:hypothetical protein
MPVRNRPASVVLRSLNRNARQLPDLLVRWRAVVGLSRGGYADRFGYDFRWRRLAVKERKDFPAVR